MPGAFTLKIMQFSYIQYISALACSLRARSSFRMAITPAGRDFSRYPHPLPQLESLLARVYQAPFNLLEKYRTTLRLQLRYGNNTGHRDIKQSYPIWSTKSHKTCSVGINGEPSYNTTAAPTARADTNQFHIIHPVCRFIIKGLRIVYTSNFTAWFVRD